MSTKAIEAEVSIRSGIDAEVEVGRGITVNVADVTLESLEATENGQYVPGAGVDGFDRVVVNVPPIEPPKDPNIVEGEFIGTEEGILQVDIPYNGDTFPKMIVVYVKDEIASLTGDFIANANVYGINALQLLKMYSTTPSYNGNSNANFARLVLLYKASNSAYNQQAVSGYSYNQGSCRWNADCLKIRDNKTMDVFIKNERDPETGGIFFMKGIRYTYQIFY